MPDLLFLTFENLILVEKQLYREMKRRLSVFLGAAVGRKRDPLKNACFALFLPLFGLFLPLFSPFWGVRAMRRYGGYGRLARSKLLKTPSNPQSDLAPEARGTRSSVLGSAWYRWVYQNKALAL